MKALIKVAGWWRLPIALGFAFVVALIASAPTLAVETRAGDRVVVGVGQTVGDDLYATGNTVVVDGTVRGDLVAFGTRVAVNGTVEGDLIAAGQAVVVEGTIEDDARVAGQVLALGQDARVGDDLISAGASLENKPGSTVGGDLLYGGSQALLAGTVDGNVKAGLAALELSGRTGGNVDVTLGDADAAPPFVPASPATVPDVQPGLTLTDSAQVDGDLAYQAAEKARISPGAEVSGEVRREALPGAAREPAPSPAAAVLDDLRRLVALLLVGLLLVWVAPRWTRALADTVRDRPLPSLGWGALTAVGAGVSVFVLLLATVLLAVIFGLITLGGLIPPIVGVGVLAIAALIIGLAISVTYLAPVVVGFAGGRLLLGWALPGRAAGRVLPLALGLILYVALRAIPIAGPIIGLIVALLGLGAVAVWAWATLRPKPEPEG